LDYHNITPPEWFAGWEPAVAYGLAWGRAQLRALAPRAGFGLADSAYNAAELARAGQRRTAVLPILLPDDEVPPDAARVAELKEVAGARWVFVGRLAPNKRQHLLIAALHAYRRAYDPMAHLDLVGGASSPSYARALRAFARDLGLAAAVTFTGAVPDDERNARYAAADVFVCLSAHEGFLVPLVEAWRHDVPVVAYTGAPAVAETMGDAGVAVPEATAPAAAAAVARVLHDPALAAELRRRGAARAACFGPERTRARLLELAQGLADGLADRPGLAGLRR
ncbi:MAG TPA: glycosyltransferase, partial [Acidimicrobiales bacterium]|nr:glycosyltransferase [Acidimicrobiales bacterium]